MRIRTPMLGTLALAFASVSMLIPNLSAVAFAQTGTSAISPGPASPSGPFAASKDPDGPLTPSRSQPIDLNGATVPELAGLPGVGTTYAKAIVAGRPYQKKHELVARKIIPSNVYRHIEKLVYVKPS